MTEGATLAEFERLLDALPDDAARQRVIAWATAKYATAKPIEAVVKFVPATQKAASKSSLPCPNCKQCGQPTMHGGDTCFFCTKGVSGPLEWFGPYKPTPTVNPPVWVPALAPTFTWTGNTNPFFTKCAFDGLPPGAYGLVCQCPKCSPFHVTVTAPKLADCFTSQSWPSQTVSVDGLHWFGDPVPRDPTGMAQS